VRCPGMKLKGMTFKCVLYRHMYVESASVLLVLGSFWRIRVIIYIFCITKSLNYINTFVTLYSKTFKGSAWSLRDFSL